ncbi:MAG TPA: rRNA maturation RNase YbeY [Bryobacteraceae bacterium]|nr:rRNA maturation RNase YbeY [Bryobacteraceae bacterium]
MSPDDIPLLFHSSLRHPLPRMELRAFFQDVVKRVARGRPITCLITNDRELRRLNRVFRKKDYATDVLSFPMDEGGMDEGGGEIAISLDRAVVQARECGHGVADEIRILMLHGVLHLTGMDHESDSGEMARAEMRWRKRLGLPDSLIERASA